MTRALCAVALAISASPAAGSDRCEASLSLASTQMSSDVRKGVSTLEEAARASCHGASFELARLYLEGRGVPPDIATAFTWALEPAVADYPGARAVLDAIVAKADQQTRPVLVAHGARLLEQARYEPALLALMPLAYTGDRDAQVALGDMYLSGLGTARDTGEAYVWWGISARARSRQARLAKHWTPEERTKLDAVAAQWQPWAWSAAAAGEIFPPISGTRMTLEKFGPHPVYPEQARRNATNGKVVLRVTIGESGQVERAYVVSCNSPKLGFEEAALDAILATRYSPPIVDGKAQKVTILVTTDFKK